MRSLNPVGKGITCILLHIIHTYRYIYIDIDIDIDIYIDMCIYIYICIYMYVWPSPKIQHTCTHIAVYPSHIVKAVRMPEPSLVFGIATPLSVRTGGRVTERFSHPRKRTLELNVDHSNALETSEPSDDAVQESQSYFADHRSCPTCSAPRHDATSNSSEAWIDDHSVLVALKAAATLKAYRSNATAACSKQSEGKTA